MRTPTPRPLPVSNVIVRRFHRGKQHPRGVAWFGIRSFWGHLRHFIASAIATEDVDCRDWMVPDDPQKLVERIARQLGAAETGQTLIECLRSDLWIDYIADTGDDSSVSEAVARCLFRPYELPDPERPGQYVVAPVGDILLFGGDTAYPVATSDEIHNRVVVPFNKALRQLGDGRSRVLLAIPGNHDWYDGLDGFARIFRRKHEGDEEELRPSVVQIKRRVLEHYADWAKEFVRGGHIEKPRALLLDGYTAVQRASYFALPLSPRIGLIAADRQLKHIDHRQQRFLGQWQHENADFSLIVALPDPVRAFGAPSPTGIAMIDSLGLDLEHRTHLIMSGDIHHYARWSSGMSTHVVAGGGGAFLHPAPIARQNIATPDIEWPTAAQSKALLWSVPLKVGLGRSGIIPHLICLTLFAPVCVGGGIPAAIGVALVSSLIYALIGGVRRSNRILIWLVAVMAGCLTAALAIVTAMLVGEFARAGLLTVLALPVTLILAAFLGAFVFGSVLALFTRLGLENTQAFTALDHPGFKHFMRLRVRESGDAVDLWCVGLIDPLKPETKPVLVDHFTWRPGGPDAD